jgi:hypothetical protein
VRRARSPSPTPQYRSTFSIYDDANIRGGNDDEYERRRFQRSASPPPRGYSPSRYLRERGEEDENRNRGSWNSYAREPSPPRRYTRSPSPRYEDHYYGRGW